MDFQRVTDPEQANPDAIIVTLFLCREERIRGWYVGPVSSLNAGAKVPYVARSANMLGVTALLKAHGVAKDLGLAVFVVDPDNLLQRIIDGRY